MGLIEREGFGGLNSDDEDRALPKGDYRYALNIRNGSSDTDNVGAIENVKGNEITFRSLPAGTNKVVGSYDDEVGGSIYYLIQNSNKNDSILRFYIATQTIEKVAQADFSFTGAPIHSIDLVNNNLFYWTDGNSEPKKINVEKGNDENKNRKVNLYFDIESAENWAAGSVSYTLSIDDKFNAAVYPLTLPNIGIETTTRDEVAERFAFYINQQIATLYPSGALTATACGPYIEIEFDFPGESTATFTASDSSAMDVPVNWYNLLTADVVNQIKAPLPCEPTADYENDETRQVNYIERTTFQFATRLVYDDFEKTVLSPYSCLVAESQCNSEFGSDNCIKVTFTDPRLNDASSLSAIRKVDLVVREGNSGAWKLVESIDQWNFGIGRQYYKFYNDGVYTILSDEEAFKLYDTVPLKSGTQEFIKNRLHHADITEGFDPVCVDAEIDVQYDPALVPVETRTLTGKLTIINTTTGASPQPIWSVAGDGSDTMFGGLKEVTPGDIFESNTGTSYQQSIPLEGFVFYLAGTDYHGITKNNAPAGVTLVSGTRNTYDGSDSTKRDAIRAAMVGLTSYQTFEIPDVPVGRYILRIAGHLITEVDGNYQKTSTYTADVAAKGFTEVELEVTTTNVIVNGTPRPAYDVGPSVIADLTNAASTPGVRAMGLAGYTTDKDLPDLDSGSHTFEEYLTDTRIEKANIDVFLEDPVSGDSNIIVKTDHNGFFFISRIDGGPNPLIKLKVDPAATASGLAVLTPTTFDETGTAWTENTGSQTDYIIVRNTNATVSANSRTKIEGFIKGTDNQGLKGISVVPTFGTTGVTDSTGQYSLIVYSDTVGSSRTTVWIPVVDLGGCFATFVPDRQVDTFNIDAANFNYASPYTAASDFIATIVFGDLLSGFKRGWDGQFGIIYRDIGGRTSVVQTEIKLKKHVNFYTEVDENGNQEAFGIPQLTWSIQHTPPSWATHYQWVRTKNEGVGEYLQWAAKAVTPIDKEGNTTGYGAAVNIKIDISNLVDYQTEHPSSIIGIDPDDTYRVRFISDKDGNIFDSYIDVPILEGTTSSEIIIEKSNSIVITEGTLFEIYRPKLDSDLKLYYEMGECHEIINVNHQGPTQNQFQWQFDDNARADAYAVIVGAPIPTFPLNLVFTTSQTVNPLFSGVPHAFTVGDTINTIQDLGATHPTYDGQFTVVEIIDSFSITVSILFAGATPVESGLSQAPAVGTFAKGDVYYRLRDIPTENGSELVFVDDPNVSDFYVSNDQSIGRLQIEDPNSKEIRNENKDVWSGKIFEGTAINNLNQFSGANFESLDKDYGKIYKLQRTENVLLAICQFRTVALYINEAVITTADGSDSITKSNAVVGTVRALRGMYGTVNPESVYLYEGNIYYWDLTTGEVIRYSNNGLQPISDYKMSNFFRNKAKDILDRGIAIPNVVGVYDPSFNEYILCFDAYQEIVAETVAFSENLTRWTTFYSYFPEHIQKIGQNLVTFKDGQVWLQNDNTDYNNFNGVQFTSQIRIVSNEAPKNMKVFKTISYESNLPWSCPEITIPANDKYKAGMSSRLKAPKFINKEGIFYSEFLKDYNTPGFTVPSEALINGRDLRGKIIEILLETEETDLVVMFSFNVKSTLSEMSNRQLI